MTAPSARGSGPSLCEPGSLVPVRGFREDRRADEPTLASVYALDSTPLGRGSYGEVTGALHRRTGARRAVKSVGKASLRRYVKDVSGFVRREVDILRCTDHPNIVRLYEAFEDDANIHLVLELCDGGDLLERVTVARERLPEQEAAALLLQMLSAVQHLYLRGDLKPENFLFTRREPEREPLPPLVAPLKLIDFGLSRRLSFEAGMRITPKIGTAEYMAPEAFAGRMKPMLADRSDMWSLGVVLHVIFIGHFPSPRLAELAMDDYLSLPCWSRISAHGRDLLGQLLNPDPAQRPPVTHVLRHPWLVQAVSRSGSFGLPAAISSYARAAELRRLALAAAAREVDDCELKSLRAAFQELELECGGSLTRAALERAAQQTGRPACALAGQLARAFAALDVDGSGAVEWTELVAASLCAGGIPVSPTGRGPPALPALNDDTCWRSFSLLSQGAEFLTGETLARLVAPMEASDDLPRCSGGPSGGTGGSVDKEAPVNGFRSQRVADLHRMVRDVDSSAAINTSSFFALMQGA